MVNKPISKPMPANNLGKKGISITAGLSAFAPDSAHHIAGTNKTIPIANPYQAFFMIDLIAYAAYPG